MRGIGRSFFFFNISQEKVTTYWAGGYAIKFGKSVPTFCYLGTFGFRRERSTRGMFVSRVGKFTDVSFHPD